MLAEIILTIYAVRIILVIVNSSALHRVAIAGCFYHINIKHIKEC